MRTFRPIIFAITAVFSGFLSHLAYGQVESLGVRLSTFSRAGRELILSFPEETVTKAAKTAVVCITPAASLSLAKLWMPDMGHGSSATTLAPQDLSCTAVERLHFLMPGVWELRLNLVDGDTATFSFDVAP